MTGYTEVIGRSSALADDFRKGPSLVSTSLWQRAQVCTAHVSHLASRGLVFKTYHTGSQRTREAFMLARLHTVRTQMAIQVVFLFSGCEPQGGG